MPFVTLTNNIKYVIGIDFGNGETSVAFASLDAEGATNIEIDKKSTIVSAIGFDSDNNIVLGNEVIVNSDPNKIKRAYIKGSPKELDNDPDRKNLFKTFIQEIYNKAKISITKGLCSELNDQNHIVFVACPSLSGDWNDEERAKYAMFMAEECGLPILRHSTFGNMEYGVFRESRAAYVYFKQHSATRDMANDNLLVIDFGSSTVDMTYHASATCPIDRGYTTIGAQKVEENVLDWILSDDNNALEDNEIELLKSFKNDKGWWDYTKLAVRRTKENFYKDNAKCMEISLKPRKITGNPRLPMSIEMEVTKDVLKNKILSEYKNDITKSFVDFKTNCLKGKHVSAIIITGGASRMDFVEYIAEAVFNGVEIKTLQSKEDISLVVSNGIAKAGVVEIKMLRMLHDMLNKLSKFSIEDLKAIKIARPIEAMTNSLLDKAMIVQERVLKEIAKPGSEYNTYNKIDNYLKAEITKTLTIHTSKMLSDYIDNLCACLSADFQKEIDIQLQRYFPGTNVSLPNWGNITAKGLMNNMGAMNISVTDLDFPVELIALNIAATVAGTALITCLNILLLLGNAGISVINFFLSKNNQIEKAEYIDLENAVTNFGFNPNDNISDRRRTKIYNEFTSKKDERKQELKVKIREELTKCDNFDEVELLEQCKTKIASYIKLAIGEIRHLLR